VKREQTQSSSKDHAARELLANTLAQHQVDQVPEPSHLSDPRAANSNKPVVEEHPVATKNNNFLFYSLYHNKLDKR